MDTDSILGETILYLRYLQERVKDLEEQVSKKNVQPDEVLLKKSKEDDVVLKKSVENDDEGSSRLSFPTEIEVRVSDKEILLKIQCKKRKRVLVQILGEIERMNLSVGNISVAPFGISGLDITIVAEMDEEFSLTVDDVVTAIGAGIRINI